MTDTITVKLNDPLHANNQTYSELTFRKPTVGDLEDAQEEGVTNPVKISRTMLALCANIPPPDFRKISFDDWAKIQQEVKPFFAASQQMLATQL